jgi:hypothetical protein
MIELDRQQLEGSAEEVRDARDWPELDRLDAIHDLEHARVEAVEAPEPEALPVDLDLTSAAVMGRRVRLPGDAIRTLGLGELAHVSRIVELPLDSLSSALRSPRGPEVALAIAYVLALRLEPGATWEDAQRWTLEVVAPTEGNPTRPRPSS